jgi:hypothetical protein
MGYSLVDSLPIYEVVEDYKLLEEKGIEFKECFNDEISKNIFTNLDLEVLEIEYKIEDLDISQVRIEQP